MNASYTPAESDSSPHEQKAADLTALMAHHLLRHDFGAFSSLLNAYEYLSQKPRGYSAIVGAMKKAAQIQQTDAEHHQIDLNRPLKRFGQVAGIFLLCVALGSALLYLGSSGGSWVAFGLGLLFLGLLPFIAWLPFSSPLCPSCSSPSIPGSKHVRLYEGGVLPLHQCRVCAQEFYLFEGLSLLEHRSEAGLVLSQEHLKERGQHWRRTWALGPTEPVPAKEGANL